jgi:hypothetical protein
MPDFYSQDIRCLISVYTFSHKAVLQGRGFKPINFDK